MRNKEKRGKNIVLWGFIYVITFIAVFCASAVIKMTCNSSQNAYKTNWDESVGIVYTDISYDKGEANKYDLYLPADKTKENYGLVVYLHAGGFTTGDKSDDEQMLKWLCSKGYVAAGINYTLRTDTNSASVLSQSNEIKAAIPQVVEKAAEYGYQIDKLTMAGGSAGHALRLAQKVIAQDFFPRLLRQNRDRVGKGGVAEQDGLTADGKWVFLVRLRRGKLDKLLVHQIVKGNLPFPLPFKLQNLVQGGTADNSLAKGVVPALDIFLIGYLVGHGNSPF